MPIQTLDFAPTQADQLQAMAEVWNAACGSNLAISARFVGYNTQPSVNCRQVGQLALLNGEPVGFVLASTLKEEPRVMPPECGWIDALAVAPAAQRQQLGSELLAWAEAWLRGQGCHAAVLGMSLHPFVPGVPTELDSVAFFERQGYATTNTVWDMAANLAAYTMPATVRPIDGVVRPARRGEEGALLDFLYREFPGRWRYECESRLRDPHHRFSDYMLLWTERGVDGFCLLTFEDSEQPMERFYPYHLPRPWGQLGSVGVSVDCRGRGFGAALLDAGLRRLHNNGVNGCVIDWLTIVDFYAKFGFAKHREYQQMGKSLLS